MSGLGPRISPIGLREAMVKLGHIQTPSWTGLEGYGIGTRLYGPLNGPRVIWRGQIWV